VNITSRDVASCRSTVGRRGWAKHLRQAGDRGSTSPEDRVRSILPPKSHRSEVTVAHDQRGCTLIGLGSPAGLQGASSLGKANPKCRSPHGIKQFFRVRRDLYLGSGRLASRVRHQNPPAVVEHTPSSASAMRGSDTGKDQRVADAKSSMAATSRNRRRGRTRRRAMGSVGIHYPPKGISLGARDVQPVVREQVALRDPLEAFHCCVDDGKLE